MPRPAIFEEEPAPPPADPETLLPAVFRGDMRSWPPLAADFPA